MHVGAAFYSIIFTDAGENVGFGKLLCAYDVQRKCKSSEAFLPSCGAVAIWGSGK
jgi:hypothetical protein